MENKTKMKKKKNNEKVKKVIFTILHIIGYITTIIFIVLLTIASVQSCDNTKKQPNTSLNTYNEVVYQKPINNLLDDKDFILNETLIYDNYLYVPAGYFTNKYFIDNLLEYIKTNGTTVSSYVYYLTIDYNLKEQGNVNSYACHYLTIDYSYSQNILNTDIYFRANNAVSNSTGDHVLHVNYIYDFSKGGSTGLGRFTSSSSTTSQLFNYIRVPLTNTSFCNFVSALCLDIDNGNYASSSSFKTINLINIYNNQSFNVLINGDYHTWYQYYINDVDTNISLSGENNYVSWNGLGALYTNATLTNQLQGVGEILEGNNYYYYLSDITQDDLDDEYNEGLSIGRNQGYSEGYDSGYSEGFSNATEERSESLVISTNNPFVYIYNGQQVSNFFPNLYYDNTLNNYYQNTYTINNLAFRITTNGIVYNTIEVNYKRLSDLETHAQEPNQYGITYPIALIDGTFTIESDFTDYRDYDGFTTLPYSFLGTDSYYNGYDKYYFVDSVYYIAYNNNNEETTRLKVFEGLKTYSEPLQTATYDVNATNGFVLSNPSYTGAYYFVRNGWLDNSYRQLTFINNSQYDLVNFPNSNLNSLTITGFLTYQSNINVSGDINNIFALFYVAFTSVGGLLSYQILPNMTLGVLLFIPLVAIIVMIIINILRHG